MYGANDKIGHRPRRAHHFSFRGGEGVGGIRKFLVFHYVSTGVPHVPNGFLIKSLKFLIVPHFIRYPLPKGFPFLTYMAQSKGRHSILT
jgi:hypothetical protein